MNKDREGKLKMEPIWDWDLSWVTRTTATEVIPTAGTTRNSVMAMTSG
jgi:hypothetical protein